jgi:hypothetical protein
MTNANKAETGKKNASKLTTVSAAARDFMELVNEFSYQQGHGHSRGT